MSTIAHLAISLTARTKKFAKGMDDATRKITQFASSTSNRLRQLTQNTSRLARVTRGFDSVVVRAARGLANYASRASVAVRKLNNFGRAVKGSSTIMKVWKAQMAWFIRGFGILAAGRIIFGGLRAIEMFNRAMNQSLAIMGNVSDAMRTKMEAAAIEMSRVTVFSSEQIAKGYFFLASAGLSAAQSLAALPIVTRFAQAGMFDMARATDLLTDAQSALGLSVKDTQQNMLNMRRIGDVLVKANTLANATVEQLSQAMTTKAAAAFRLVGKDVEELAAVLAVFADQGIKGAEAGSGLAIVMRDMQTKALKNAKAFKDMGVRVFDSSREMRHLADIYKDLENVMRGQSDAQKKLTLMTLGFTDKSIAFTQALIGTSGKIRELDTALRGAAGTMSEVANKQMTELQVSMANLNATFLRLTESSGSLLLFGIASSLDNVSTLARLAAVALSVFNGDMSVAIESTRALRVAEEKLAVINEAKNNPLGLSKKQIALNRKISASIQARRDKIEALNRSIQAHIIESEEPWLVVLRENAEALKNLGLDKYQQQLRDLDAQFDRGSISAEIHEKLSASVRKRASSEREFVRAAEESLRISIMQKRIYKETRTPLEQYNNAVRELIKSREHLTQDTFVRKARLLFGARAAELERMDRKDKMTFGFEVARSTNIKFLNKNRQEKQQVEDKAVAKLLAKEFNKQVGVDVARVTAPRGGIR